MRPKNISAFTFVFEFVTRAEPHHWVHCHPIVSVDRIFLPFLRPFLLYVNFCYHLFYIFSPSPNLVIVTNTIRGAIYKTEHLTTAPAFSLLRANYRAVHFYFFILTQLMGILYNTRILSSLVYTFARTFTSSNFKRVTFEEILFEL